jgi:hypothetical protein
MDRAIHDAKVRGWVAGGREGDGVYGLCWSSNCLWLAGAECNDAPDGVVRRNADGHAIARNDFDTEAAHSTTELGQHFMAGVTLHSVEPATVHGDDGALHVNQIILAQLLANPFCRQTLCHICIWSFGYLVIWSLIGQLPNQ